MASNLFVGIKGGIEYKLVRNFYCSEALLAGLVVEVGTFVQCPREAQVMMQVVQLLQPIKVWRARCTVAATVWA